MKVGAAALKSVEQRQFAPAKDLVLDTSNRH